MLRRSDSSYSPYTSSSSLLASRSFARPRCDDVVSCRTLTAAGALLAVSAVLSGAETAGRTNFNFDIRPVLSDRCFKCHGPDERARQAGLRLDLEESALAPRTDGRTPIR